MTDRPRSAGEGGSEFVDRVVAVAWATIRAAGMVFLPAGMIFLDLWLGPMFIEAYASENEVALSGMSFLTPWIFSFATTGLQLALWDRTRAGFANSSVKAKLVIAFGWLVAVADTLTDIGGFTAWLYGPEMGANIWPEDPIALGVAILVGAICLSHERLLQVLLARWQDHASEDDSVGAGIVRTGVAAGGYIANWSKMILKPAGVFSMIVLDVILTPQFMNIAVTDVIGWLISGILTALNLGLWDQLDKVGIRGLDKGDRTILLVAWLISIADTVGDVIGFTTVMYGHGEQIRVLPPVMSWTWVLTTFIVVALCFAGEPLLTEMLRKRKRGASRQGFSAISGQAR